MAESGVCSAMSMSEIDIFPSKGNVSTEDISDLLAPGKVELNSKMDLPEVSQDDHTLEGLVQLQMNDSDDEESETETGPSQTLSHSMKIEEGLQLNMTEPRDAGSKLSILSTKERLNSSPFQNCRSTPNASSLGNDLSTPNSPSLGFSTQKKPHFVWRRADESAHATIDILKKINMDLCKNKDLRKVQDLYQTEIHWNPRNTELLRAYSCFLAAIGERNSAEKYLQDALQINPRSLESSISYAELLLAGIDYKKRYQELQKAEMLLLKIQDIFPDHRRIEVLLDKITSTISKHEMSMFVSSSGFLNIQGKKDRTETMPSFTPQRRRVQLAACFNMLKDAVLTFEEEISNIKKENGIDNQERVQDLQQQAEERLNKAKLECLREDIISKDSVSKPFSFEHENDSSKVMSERESRNDDDDERKEKERQIALLLHSNFSLIECISNALGQDGRGGSDPFDVT
eukprot:747261-Hanusia_phi.AAC.6